MVLSSYLKRSQTVSRDPWMLSVSQYAGDVPQACGAACNGMITLLPLLLQGSSAACRASVRSLQLAQQDEGVFVTTQAQAQELVCRAVRTVVLDVSRENCRCYLSSLLMGCVMTRHGICLESEIQDALSQSTAEDFHKRLDDVVVPSFCNDVIHSLLGHMTELEQYNQLCEQDLPVEEQPHIKGYLEQMELAVDELRHRKYVRSDPTSQVLAELLDRWIIVVNPDAINGDDGLQPSCEVQVYAPCDVDVEVVTHLPFSKCLVLLYGNGHYMALPVPTTMRVQLLAPEFPPDKDPFNAQRTRMVRGVLLLGDVGLEVEAGMGSVARGSARQRSMVAAEPVTASGAAAFGVPGDIERQVAGKPGLRGQSLSVPRTSSHQVAAATVPWLGVNSADAVGARPVFPATGGDAADDSGKEGQTAQRKTAKACTDDSIGSGLGPTAQPQAGSSSRLAAAEVKDTGTSQPGAAGEEEGAGGGAAAAGGRNKRKCDIPATHWNTASKEDQEAVEAIMRDLAAAVAGAPPRVPESAGLQPGVEVSVPGKNIAEGVAAATAAAGNDTVKQSVGGAGSDGCRSGEVAGTLQIIDLADIKTKYGAHAFQVKGPIAGSKIFFHGEFDGKECAWRRHPLPEDLNSPKMGAVLNACLNDLNWGLPIEAERYEALAPATRGILSEEHGGIYMCYPACMCSLEGLDLSGVAYGVSKDSIVSKVHNFYNQAQKSLYKAQLTPNHFDPDRVLVTKTLSFFLADYSQAAFVPRYAGHEDNAVVMAESPPGFSRFAAPNRERETSQCVVLPACLSELYILSNRNPGVSYEALSRSWKEDKVLDVRSFIPDDSMQPLAHMLQLGLRKDSAKRLRLEARLGHTCHWQGTPLKALGVLETIEKLISDTRNNWHPESFLNVAEEKMQPLLRDGGFLRLMGAEAIRCMRYKRPGRTDYLSRQHTCLKSSMFDKAWPAIKGTRFLSSHVQEKTPVLKDILNPRPDETWESAFWRWMFDDPGRRGFWLLINEIAIDCKQADCSTGFWEVPDFCSPDQEHLSALDARSHTKVTASRLLELAQAAESLESGRMRQSSTDGGGEEDDQLVVTALKQMSGTCRLLDLPSLEGQELDVVRQFLRSNPDVIEAAYERLRQPDLPEEFATDRLKSLVEAILVSGLVTEVALLACCESTLANILANKTCYDFSAVGMIYVSSRFPTGNLPDNLQLSPEQQQLIKSCLILHHLKKDQKDAALAVNIRGSRKLQALHDLVQARRTHEWYQLLKMCSESTDPVLHIYLRVLQPRDWQKSAAKLAPPVDADGKPEERVSLVYAAQRLGFYSPAAKPLLPMPYSCVYHPLVERKVLGALVGKDADVVDKAMHIVKEFLGRHGSRRYKFENIQEGGKTVLGVVYHASSSTSKACDGVERAVTAQRKPSSSSAAGGTSASSRKRKATYEDSKKGYKKKHAHDRMR